MLCARFAVVAYALSCAVGAIGARVSRDLLSSGSPQYMAVATIYNDGLLEAGWHSWSWGMTYYNQKTVAAAMQGSRSALCMQVQPYGALSLKSSIPFTLDGTLGFYMRGSNLTVEDSAASGGAGSTAGSAQQYSLGDMEVQFESSSPSTYTISKSATLRELLRAQAPEGSDRTAYAEDALAAIQAGEWTAVKVDMRQFVPTEWSGKFDRITMGTCLQRMDKCGGGSASGMSHLAFCLDKVVMVNQ